MPEKRILSSAHTAIVVPPDDAHYGANGGYANCLHYYDNDSDRYKACMSQPGEVWWGETSERNLERGLLRRLMYNPHYAAMEASLQKFIQGLS